MSVNRYVWKLLITPKALLMLGGLVPRGLVLSAGRRRLLGRGRRHLHPSEGVEAVRPAPGGGLMQPRPPARVAQKRAALA